MPAKAASLDARHRRVAAWCGAIVLTMVGVAYASVPLYRLFCQATGYGGTTQTADKGSHIVLDEKVVIRFDANVAPGLAWKFEPVVATLDVRIGESTLAFFKATNTSARPLVGNSTFNVTPEMAGRYFNKLECFCFTEQRLEPGETVEMPVSFFLDPAIADDAQAARIGQITLSYTFYPVEHAKVAPSPIVKTPAAGAKGS